MSVLDFIPPVPGRKIDVLALQTATPFTLSRVQYVMITADGGRGCYGMQKLAQKVFMRLFTAVGGKLYDRTQGVTFVNQLLAGRIRTTVDASAALVQARDTIESQFIVDVEADSTIPLDERLAELVILSTQIVGDELYVSLRITSAAGETGEFKTPITVK